MALFEVSKVIASSTKLDEFQTCIEFIRNLILPLAQVQGQRGNQNDKIATMLQQLEGEEVIALLSDLHAVITPIYHVYANKKTGYLDFQAFIKFCTDFSVFPDVVTKSDAYRIFMNLAF